jgi:hypothetical protein
VSQLGLVAASEAVIVDNDSAIPSFHGDVDATWDLGEAAFQWAAAHIAGALNLGGDLNHDGINVGFYSTTPAAQSAAYSPTNVTPDRAYDADATSLDEIADVLGTLIVDLQLTGIIG